ncbi:MAG: ABC transporter ATP-binding protein [Chloroflexi bacterium]|nr:ABC transporter ATP-binding protein [Chloroflexota bacterium]
MTAKQGPPSTPPAIRTEGLTKVFGSRMALRGINLEVQQGQSLVIFGPNGAGKTTLIKILATITNPSSGTFSVDGLDVKNHPEDVRRRIGIVTHQTFLYGNLTAYENLEFYSRMFDVPGRKERIHELAEQLGMTYRLHDRVATLSRGMQQRFSIARALLHKPSVMLLDEPETGLDQEALAILWKALPGENERKRTIILATHNLERGLELGDRLVILDRGKIVYDGLREVMDLRNLEEVYRNATGANN